MFYFLAGIFAKASKEAKKEQSEKDKKAQSSSGYVYTDYEAQIRKAERKKNKKVNS